jgi:hypothetical protein
MGVWSKNHAARAQNREAYCSASRSAPSAHLQVPCNILQSECRKLQKSLAAHWEATTVQDADTNWPVICDTKICGSARGLSGAEPNGLWIYAQEGPTWPPATPATTVTA